jgi:hypothetical protein
MILISHRGNINGKLSNKENAPYYVNEALELGYNVEIDFYWDNGNMVMTEEYHKRRGSCCGNRCKHCPFSPKYIKMNKQLKEY